MKNRLTLLAGAALLAMSSMQAQASQDQGWDLSGIFDSALESIGISAPLRGVAKTPIVAPTPDLTNYDERFKTQQTTTGGLSTCNSRSAVSQQSASQYLIKYVSRAY